MEKVFRSEQHYAVSSTGKLAHIKEAHNNPDNYYCPFCGCKMLKRCGNIRTWHFAHDWRDANEFQKNCSYETYLHGYAKLRLKQWFDESSSITLHYKQSIVCKKADLCNLIKNENCRKDIKNSCDLKVVFNRCTIESSVKGANGNYRADLLLTSDSMHPQHILLIEIKVSHGCSEKKKASNTPIIEFDVTSEDDVDYIVSHDIVECDKVRFYGFKKREIPDNAQLISPARTLQQFTLYKSGKTFCKTTNCQSITYHKPSSLFELTTYISENNFWVLNLYGLMKAREQGFSFPNCYHCKHNCYSEENNCYVCEINNVKIEKGADALNCDDYIFKPDYSERIKDLQPKVLDIWSHNTTQ